MNHEQRIQLAQQAEAELSALFQMRDLILNAIESAKDYFTPEQYQRQRLDAEAAYQTLWHIQISTIQARQRMIEGE